MRQNNFSIKNILLLVIAVIAVFGFFAVSSFLKSETKENKNISETENLETVLEQETETYFEADYSETEALEPTTSQKDLNETYETSDYIPAESYWLESEMSDEEKEAVAETWQAEIEVVNLDEYQEKFPNFDYEDFDFKFNLYTYVYTHKSSKAHIVSYFSYPDGTTDFFVELEMGELLTATWNGDEFKISECLFTKEELANPTHVDEEEAADEELQKILEEIEKQKQEEEEAKKKAEEEKKKAEEEAAKKTTETEAEDADN